MCTVFPAIVGPDLATELATITAMNEGNGPAGSGGLLPGPVAQLVPQVTVAGAVSNPLNDAGAAPPERLFSFDHCAPQKVTDVPTAAFWSPMTKLPPATTQKTNAVVDDVLF